MALARREVLALDTDPRSPDRGRYSFVQALFRDVAYSTLARRDRRARHLAAARHYEAIGEEQSGPLAEQSTWPPTGRRRTVRRARRRRSRPGSPCGPPPSGPERWAPGSRPRRTSGPPARSRRMTARRRPCSGGPASSSIYAGRYAEGIEILREALTLLQGAGDRSAVRAPPGLLASGLLAAGWIGEAIQLLEGLVPEYDALVDDEAGGRFAEAYGRALFRSGHSEEALTWCERGVARCEAAGLAVEGGNALVTKASVLIELGRRREGMALLRGTRDLLEDEGLHWIALRAIVNISSFSVDDDPRAAYETARAGLEVATRLGLLGYFTYLVGNAAGAAERTGDWDYVLEQVRLGIQLLRDEGARDYAAFVAAGFETWRGEDRHDVMDAIYRTGLAADDPQQIINAAGSLRREAYLQGRYADGVAWQRVTRERGVAGTNELAWAARCALHAGDVGELATLDVEINRTPGRRALLADQGFVRAAIAVLAGRRDEALAGFRASIDRYREAGCRFDLALTVLDVALSLGPEAAADLGVVDEARATFAELGVAALVTRLDAAVVVASPA